MMLDRLYRQRLEGDLARWQAAGVITPATGAAIRGALPPIGAGINIAVVVGIIGGLLIAAAFLAFIAANWTGIARPLRFAILAAGMASAYGLGACFARTERVVLADLCASVGSSIFGAGIALVGQMYHLGGDFAAGMMLWAAGALAASALTGSRGALAVALMAACIWTCSLVADTRDIPHLPFVVFWLLAAGLALAWNSRVAAHLVALAVLPWWLSAATELSIADFHRFLVLADGAALVFGGGLLLAASPWQRTHSLGAVFSNYGAFMLAGVAVLQTATTYDLLAIKSDDPGQPMWALACGIAGVLFAVAAAALSRRAGVAFAAAAIALVMAVVLVWNPKSGNGPWLLYTLELCGMVCLVVSGMLDDVRARVVAGWLGIAGVIAGITWTVKGSLLKRSVFLAVAGAVAVAFATVINRLLPREHA
jgi:uncharacterized membrane protein